MIVSTHSNRSNLAGQGCTCGGQCAHRQQGLGFAWPEFNLPQFNFSQLGLPQLDWKLLALLAVGGYLAWRLLFSGRSSERRSKLSGARKKYTEDRKRIYRDFPLI